VLDVEMGSEGMVEWISSWLKNIILIVLLATFVDLLLPSSNMQKYARMVMGLLIILAILTPIIDIFANELSLTELFQQLEQQQPVNASSLSEDQLKRSVESGQKEYQAKLISEVEAQMTSQLKKMIEGSYDILLTAISLDAHLEAGTFVIEHLTVYLLDNIPENEVVTTEQETIEPIQPVSIYLNEHSNSVAVEEAVPEKLDEKLVSEVERLIFTEWGIAKELIVIKYDSSK